jgi:hypothetical protein
MKKIIIILSAVAIITDGCGQTTNKQTDNIMKNDTLWYEQDKLDVEKFLENAEERIHITKDPVTTFYFFIKKFPDGREIQISSMGSEFQRREMPPLPHFYQTYSAFHKNGNIERKGKQITAGTDIGVWEYYDENGNKVGETNKDAKYPAFDYNKVLMFLQKEGHINLETGENRDNLLWISYIDAYKIWSIEIANGGKDGGSISYTIDLKTSPETVEKTINR